LTFASKWGGGVPTDENAEPGATPQSHEVFLTLHYVTASERVN